MIKTKTFNCFMHTFGEKLGLRMSYVSKTLKSMQRKRSIVRDTLQNTYILIWVIYYLINVDISGTIRGIFALWASIVAFNIHFSANLSLSFSHTHMRQVAYPLLLSLLLSLTECQARTKFTKWPTHTNTRTLFENTPFSINLFQFQKQVRDI